MDKKDRILQEFKGGYSVQSGVFGAVNHKLQTTLNGHGEYEVDLDHAFLSEEELEILASVSAMSNHELNETALGNRLFGHVPEIEYDTLLGYYSGIYAGYVVESDYRARASSGGISSWILVQLLKRKLIDGVIHVTPHNDGDGVLFKYSLSTTECEVRAGAKSRYYPADLSGMLRAAKDAGGKYAITGIPSFVTELRLLSEHDPDFRDVIAYTVGLICGHQKSTKYAEAIAWQHGIKPGDLKHVDFRKKVRGKPADQYITELVGTVAGEEVTLTKESQDVFVGSWSHGFFKSKLSDYTDDVFNETADVALGDAWLPQYSSDYMGTNLVIVRDGTIAGLLDEGLATGQLKLDRLTPAEAIRSQPGLVRHVHDELPYRLQRCDRRKSWRPQKRLDPSDDLPLIRRRVQDIREQIATMSHLHYQRAVELGDWDYFYRQMKPLVDRHNALYGITDARRILRKGPIFLVKRTFAEVRRRLRSQ